jgi:hypothetical protein
VKTSERRERGVSVARCVRSYDALSVRADWMYRSAPTVQRPVAAPAPDAVRRAGAEDGQESTSRQKRGEGDVEGIQGDGHPGR